MDRYDSYDILIKEEKYCYNSRLSQGDLFYHYFLEIIAVIQLVRYSVSTNTIVQLLIFVLETFGGKLIEPMKKV